MNTFCVWSLSGSLVPPCVKQLLLALCFHLLFLIRASVNTRSQELITPALKTSTMKRRRCYMRFSGLITSLLRWALGGRSLRLGDSVTFGDLHCHGSADRPDLPLQGAHACLPGVPERTNKQTGEYEYAETRFYWSRTFCCQVYIDDRCMSEMRSGTQNGGKPVHFEQAVGGQEQYFYYNTSILKS